MGISIQIVLSDKLYLRDPEQTELGRKILDFGIKLIDELGLEKFTFKKLATAIGSTEASIYRYFENKHKLLIYLVSWYWSWLEYLIDYQTNNIEDPKRRFHIAIEVLANSSRYDPNFSHIDENALYRIVVAESSKALMTKAVEAENRAGLFQNYKNFAGKITDLIQSLNPDYPYAKALSLTVIEAARNQIFFALHLPSLTELEVKEDDTLQIATYLEQLVLNAVNIK